MPDQARQRAVAIRHQPLRQPVAPRPARMVLAAANDNRRMRPRTGLVVATVSLLAIAAGIALAVFPPG